MLGIFEKNGHVITESVSKQEVFLHSNTFEVFFMLRVTPLQQITGLCKSVTRHDAKESASKFGNSDIRFSPQLYFAASSQNWLLSGQVYSEEVPLYCELKLLNRYETLIMSRATSHRS